MDGSDVGLLAREVRRSAAGRGSSQWLGRRRGMGAALIVVALGAAIVVGSGHRILATGGRAMADPGNLPPPVGECLVYRSPSGAMSGAALMMVTSDQLTVTDCAGQHEFEVAGGRVVTQSDLDGIAGDQSAVSSTKLCSDEDRRYLALPAPDGTSFFLSYPHLMTPLELPSADQQSVGQSWVACLMGSRYGTLTGRLAGVYRDGTNRNAVGTCIPGARPGEALGDIALVSCSVPHAIELFGETGDITAASTREAITQRCASWVERLTGTADIQRTAGLKISVQFLRASDDAVIDPWAAPAVGGASGAATGSPDADIGAFCFVETTGGRLLSGSLIALHDSAVPWTPSR